MVLVPLLFTMTGVNARDAHDNPGTRFRESLVELSTHHPRIRERALQLASKREAESFATWKYPDPKVGIFWMEFPYKKDPRDYTKPMGGVELRLTQPVPFPGRLSVEARVSGAETRMSLYQLALEKNRITREFLSQTASALALIELLNLTEEYANQIKIVADVARTRYSVGRGSLADVSRAQLRYSSYTERSVKIKGALESRIEELVYYLENGIASGEEDGRSDSARKEAARLFAQNLLTNGDLDRYEEELVRLIKNTESRLEEVSVEIALRRTELELQERKTTLSKMEVLPDMELFAAYRKRDPVQGDPGSGEDFVSFGISMRLPFWSSVSNPRNVASRKSAAKAASMSVDDTRKQIRSFYRSFHENYATLGDRIAMYDEKLIPQAKLARDSSRLAYETGRVDFSALLDSWDVLYMQESEKIRLSEEKRKQLYTIASLLNVIVPESTGTKITAPKTPPRMEEQK